MTRIESGDLELLRRLVREENLDRPEKLDLFYKMFCQIFLDNPMLFRDSLPEKMIDNIELFRRLLTRPVVARAFREAYQADRTHLSTVGTVYDFVFRRNVRTFDQKMKRLAVVVLDGW